MMGINSYIHYHSFIPPEFKSLDSLHVVSEKDEWFRWQTEYLTFDSPEVIDHLQGHKPPRYLSSGKDDSNLIKFHEFVNK